MKSSKTIAMFIGLVLIACTHTMAQDEPEPWTFVSSPDIFNFDIPNPQPKWDDAVDFFLDTVKAENPDYFLVAGDLVNGHWWDSPEQLEHLANVYYGGWVRRMEDHNLRYYACVGDHEIGDNPWPASKIALAPQFKQAFVDLVGLPRNGPEDFDGVAYQVLHKNVLLISVDTFEIRDGQMHHTVSGPQLEWLERTLTEHADVPHKVVMGHCPMVPGAKARSSSRLEVEGGTDSELWKTLTKHDVDLYLCGEFHDITATLAEGMVHLVHGASWGRVPDVNYLLVDVEPQRLTLTLKQIPLTFDGGAIWNINKERGPREYVKITDEDKAKGFTTVGTVVIDKTGDEKQFLNRTGAFAPGSVGMLR